MREKKMVFITVFAAIVLVIVGLSYFILNGGLDQDNTENTDDLNYTSTYSELSIHEVYDLIYNQSKDIILVDVPSTGISRYNESHLENALLIHSKNHFPQGIKSLYKTKKDVIFYDDFDDLGDEFGIYNCKQLVNHTYGNIYYMQGGLTDWIEYGYPYWSNLN